MLCFFFVSLLFVEPMPQFRACRFGRSLRRTSIWCNLPPAHMMEGAFRIAFGPFSAGGGAGAKRRLTGRAKNNAPHARDCTRAG